MQTFRLACNRFLKKKKQQNKKKTTPGSCSCHVIIVCQSLRENYTGRRMTDRLPDGGQEKTYVLDQLSKPVSKELPAWNVIAGIRTHCVNIKRLLSAFIRS